MYRVRKQALTGKLIVQQLDCGAWKDATRPDPFVVIGFHELDALRVRVARADSRAAAQKKARADREMLALPCKTASELGA